MITSVLILWLMILCHIIDDFVLQPVCLSNLKQKAWWQEHVKDLEHTIYKDDYVIAMFIHGLSWSIMISLPPMLLGDPDMLIMSLLILVNAFAHAAIDNEKANEHKINLIKDQCFHMLQIVLTYVCLCLT